MNTPQKTRLKGMESRAWCCYVALAALAAAHVGCGPSLPGGIGGAGGQADGGHFRGWPADRKPDFVLLLSGQQHGYIQPCGCSYPQFGGLERRYNLIQQLKKDKGWTIIPIDLGDVPQERGPQRMIKYGTSMEAAKIMGYSAFGIGQLEIQLPLLYGLGEFALNNEGPPRVLAANLQNRERDYPGAEAQAFAGGIDGVAKIGITSVVGPTVAQAAGPFKVKFDPVNQALPQVLQEFQKQKAAFQVLLFQGFEKEAQACAQQFPQFQVILHSTEEEEPPEKPLLVGSTRVIGVGHKGRKVGLVGVFRTGRPDLPFDMYYQLVELGPQYETPKDQGAGNPILTVLENYTRKVRDDNFLANYPQTKHPVQIAYPNAKYVGSDKCKKCHEYAYEVWEKSKHAHAFVSLENATRPSLRRFDGECVVCHTSGFEYETGYRNEKDTPLLKNVGCESCHGPGSEHLVRKGKDRKLLALMNPYKTPANETKQAQQRRLLGLHDACMHCHDTDNDVNWNKPLAPEGRLPTWFTRDWPKIVHMTPKE